jgi:hypothetical protein
VIHLLYHLGGFGITPFVQSSKAGFYSATAKFISWLGTLPLNADFCFLLSTISISQKHGSANSVLLASSTNNCSEIKFNEWAPPADVARDQVPPGNIAPTLPPLNLLATLQVQPWEDEDNAALMLYGGPRSHHSATSQLGL